MKEPSFDIYSGVPDPDKDARWLASVEGLSSARERMEQIAAEKPGQYFVFNPATHSILAHRNTSKKLESSKAAAS